jgi:hypothetical protein
VTSQNISFSEYTLSMQFFTVDVAFAVPSDFPLLFLSVILQNASVLWKMAQLGR